MKKEMIAANQIVHGIEAIRSGLVEAISQKQKAIEACDLRKDPSLDLCWARTHNNLGLAYIKLASVLGGRENVVKAIAAYHEALRIRTKERQPVGYANTQNNLGLAYMRLASVSGGRENVVKAIAAYHDALSVRTEQADPLKYLILHKSIGDGFYQLAYRENKLDYFLRAGKFYKKFFEIERRIGDYQYLQNMIEDAKIKFSDVKYCLE